MGASKQDFMDMRELEMVDSFPEYYPELDAEGMPEVAMRLVKLDTPAACMEYMQKQLSCMAELERKIKQVDSSKLPSSVFNDLAYRDNLILNFQWFAEQHQYALMTYTQLANTICSSTKFYSRAIQS
jgi:hypothetical protein